MNQVDLTALGEAAELVVYTSYHRNLCSCDKWPADCVTWPGGAQAVCFSVNAYNVVEAAAPLIVAATRAKVAEEIEAAKPSPRGDWDSQDWIRVQVYNDAAKIARGEVSDGS